MARPKLGPNRQPWKGIDANERAYNTVHNGLANIIIDGPNERSPEMLEKAKRVLADLNSQKPPAIAQISHDVRINQLRRMIHAAEEVVSGRRAPTGTGSGRGPALHETRRRRAVPPVSPTAPSHSAPPSSFTSPGRRTFTLGAVERSDRVGSETWTILYNGEEAGKLFRSANYGPNLPWHASTRELFWKYASDAPIGVGFDVAAFATAQQALDAWGRSADQILDWSEGKPVYTGYGHGPQQRATRESHRYPKLSPPPAHFVSPRARETGHRVADFNTLDDLVAHARGEGATHVLQIDDETHIYFQRRDGSYEKAEAWQKDGYWHTQAPGSRAVVRKPPLGAKPIAVIRPRMVESPRRSAHHHPGRRK